jgi:hypothetical protein
VRPALLWLAVAACAPIDRARLSAGCRESYDRCLEVCTMQYQRTGVARAGGSSQVRGNIYRGSGSGGSPAPNARPVDVSCDDRCVDDAKGCEAPEPSSRPPE